MTIDVKAYARAIATRVEGTAPALGNTRLILIDGPAGAGKTTLAHHLASVLSAKQEVQTLHADDMYEGWDGLPQLADVLIDQILTPLSQEAPARFRRWDWHASQRAEVITVLPVPVLIIEGVGVAMKAARVYASEVVWVHAEPAVCLRRGLERDGEAMRAEWERWQLVEQQEFARQGTQAAAHFTVTTS